MLAKLLPNYGDGQLKSIFVDKKINKIILIETNIRVIRTIAVLEVIITLHPRVVVKVPEET